MVIHNLNSMNLVNVKIMAQLTEPSKYQEKEEERHGEELIFLS